MFKFALLLFFSYFFQEKKKKTRLLLFSAAALSPLKQQLRREDLCAAHSLIRSYFSFLSAVAVLARPPEPGLVAVLVNRVEAGEPGERRRRRRREPLAPAVEHRRQGRVERRVDVWLRGDSKGHEGSRVGPGGGDVGGVAAVAVGELPLALVGRGVVTGAYIHPFVSGGHRGAVCVFW